MIISTNGTFRYNAILLNTNGAAILRRKISCPNLKQSNNSRIEFKCNSHCASDGYLE